MTRFTSRLRPGDAAWIVVVAALAVAANLGGAGRLSYHEAIVAQGAREMLVQGQVLVPTLDGRPWLEKPPLLHLLVIACSPLVPLVGPEAAARLPSAAAATFLALGIAALAAHRFGRRIGRSAGMLQATTIWTVIHGRLVESDVLLAALVVATFVAFDRYRDQGRDFGRWRWAFFALLGATSLAKGIGFGAALIVAALAVFLIWERRWDLVRGLLFPPGILLALVIALAWPLAVWLRHPSALDVWTLHVTDRLAGRSRHFAGEKGWEYALSFLWQTLPWTPLSLLGAWHVFRRRPGRIHGTHALLAAWAVVPAVLVSLASTRNAHYLIYALPPWSIWGAIGLARLLDRARLRGVDERRVRRRELLVITTVATCIGLGIGLFGPRFDRRGVEWSFYDRAGRAADPDAPLILLYDDWDRLPYPTPFGPVPHDLAVRLYYLRRPATWTDRLPSSLPCSSVSIIARRRDLPSLHRLGTVSLLLPGPSTRWDRTFSLYRVTRR